jgi:hypothetical protein
VDEAVGVLLHTTLDLPAFPLHALGLLRPGRALATVAAWGAAGAVFWVLGAWLHHRGGAAWDEALRQGARGFWPLYLRPCLTLLALFSLFVHPTWPYGFTLPVALGQDWGKAQDVLAAAAVLALWAYPFAAERFRLALPQRHLAAALGAIAFVVYAFLTPSWARVWEGHPGNEPKTLRMAVALGHRLSLDVAPVSAPMEDLPAEAFASIPPAISRVTREVKGLAMALPRGRHAWGASAITATRITRQTIQGKDGGVYHVLAPGPSLLLAPALRVDRWLNQRAGTRGPLRASLLLWNALAGALVSATYLLLRDATGRPGLSALLASLFALVPPALFYFFQFYPEMLGALVLAVALRALLFVPWWTRRRALALSLMLLTLPWLHQKFLPVWGLLTLAAVGVLVAQMAPLTSVLRLLVPQVLSFAAFTVYNFAITGSARPDALFLAWGPRGITTDRLSQGLLGLVLDARFGILPGVPLLLLAGAGLLLRGPGVSRLRLALPVVLVYYLTVAAADNWSGAVCNLGRYVMPVLPWAVALVGVAWTRLDAGRLVVALALSGWSLLLAQALWADPHAANDSAVLYARSAFADPNAYLPNLFVRSWSDALPGTALRVVAWVVLVVGLALVWRLSLDVKRVLLGTVFVLLALGLGLEAWPPTRRGPVFANAVPATAGAVVFVSGAAVVDREQVLAHSGQVQLLVRARDAASTLRVTVHGPSDGLVSWRGRAPLPIPGSGLVADVPLQALGTFTGRRGTRETLLRTELEISSDVPVALIFAQP